MIDEQRSTAARRLYRTMAGMAEVLAPSTSGPAAPDTGELHIQRGDIPDAQLYLMCANDYYALADATDAGRAVRERFSQLS